MELEMTESEICHRFKRNGCGKRMIPILAQLNAVDAAFRNAHRVKAEKEDAEDVNPLPYLMEGLDLIDAKLSIVEGFTKPPAHFTEDSLLQAMERAGADVVNEDAERKGLGTPATRADIIEKLVKDEFVKREKNYNGFSKVLCRRRIQCL